MIPLHLRAARCADEAAAAVGPEGSLALLLVEEPVCVLAVRPTHAVDTVDKMARQFVDTKGRGLRPDLPPPAHRVQWAERYLPEIGRRIKAANDYRTGVALIVWFGDRVGEHDSVWLASTMRLEDVTIFLRDYLGSRPS